MEDKIFIRVGIKTLDEPQVRKSGKLTSLDNMLIGDGFHWQDSIKAILPGKVESFEDDSNISLINILPLEDYVECVVGSEMNPAAPIEFIKAHAVISRSWALGKILRVHPSCCIPETHSDKIVGWDDTGEHIGFDVCSDDHCQRYQGQQDISPQTLEAIKATEGQVIIDSDGNLADTRFSKCCGGVTELFSTCWHSQDFNFLRSLEDPWCNLSDLSPVRRRILLSTILKDYDQKTKGYGFRWNHEISKEEIRNNLRLKFGLEIGEIIRLEPLHRGPSGRIDLLRIVGSEKNINIGKELWIRRLLSDSHLYSSAFEIEDMGDRVKLKGRGWGHGVGLCQIGAANMAANGFNYQDILKFYYPETSLAWINEKIIN